MKIKEITENKKQYLDLLLLADEEEHMIDKYIDQGRMFILEGGDNTVKAECIVTENDENTVEIKNIAVYPKYQNKGYGRFLIDFVEEFYREKYKSIIVGTGDCTDTVSFYKKCGFVKSHVINNFFTDNYSKPIFENGVQLVDMIYLKKKIQKNKF